MTGQRSRCFAHPVRRPALLQLLPKYEGVSPGVHLLIGVGGDSLAFHPAIVASQDMTGRNYQVLIPYDRPVKLSVASAQLQIADQAGKTLPNSVNLPPIFVPKNQNPSPVVLNLTGLSPSAASPR